MKKFVAGLILGTVLLWATGAFAQSYSALEDMPAYGPWFGVGGAVLSGDATNGDTESEFLVTVNLLGMTDYLVWQAFYGTGSDANAFGVNLDYMLANNFDECDVCGTDGLYWFAAGASYIDYSDAFIINDDDTTGMDDSDFGANIGAGYMFGDWQLAFFVNYFLDTEAFMGQGMLLYNLN